MVRKAKADLELNLARDMKGNKRGICCYIDDKTMENVGLLLSEVQDMEKAEVLNALFDSDFCETFKFRIAILYLQQIKKYNKGQCNLNFP